jgi:hypothetical protein
MSIESFVHLIRLTGAVRPPPALYDGNWPGLLRRGLQTAVNALANCSVPVAPSSPSTARVLRWRQDLCARTR